MGTYVARRDAVPFLGAPLPSLAPAPSLAETGSATASAESAGLPIFDSVESEYFGPRDVDRLRLSELRYVQSTLTAGPSTAPGSRASAADGGPGAEADAPAASGLTSTGLPQLRRQASLVPDSVADRRTLRATPGSPAQIAQTRLASFQQGSRRARAVARTKREAKRAHEE